MFDLKSQLQDYVEANIERVDIDDLASAVLDQPNAHPQSPPVRRARLTVARRPVAVAGAAAMIVLLLIGGAWLLTSRGEDSPVITQAPTPSSTVPLGAPDSQWSSAVLDSAGLTGVSPRVLAVGDGGLVIAYQREVEPSMYETLVVSCVNAECVDPVIVQVAPPERSRMVEAALGRDGSPIVLLRRSTGIGGGSPSSQSAVLVVCSDPACASAEETVLAEAFPIGLAVTPNGESVVAYGSSEGTGTDIYVGVCEDAACRVHEPVLVGSESGIWLTSGALQLLPDGSPVLFYADSPPSESSRQIVAVCGDPGCSSVEVTEVLPGMGADQGAAMQNLPYWPYVSQFESVGLIGCGDERCTSVFDRQLYRPFDGTMLLAAHVTSGDDGMPVLAIETISPDESSGGGGDGYATHEVLWVLCGDPACETVSVNELGEGATISMASLSDDDVVVVAAQTGLPYLCVVEGCADPTAEGLSTLTLYSCHGSDCLNPPSEDTVEVLGDVAVLDGGVGSAMVFVAEGDLYVLEPGPGTARRLSEGVDWEGGPVWSSDGARIAFHTDRDAPETEGGEDYNIYVMDADGTNLVQITDDPAGEFFPDWSPDGTRLVFARQSENSETRYLVIVDLATGDEQQLTDPTSDADFPVWSPDGTTVAFSSRTSGDCSWVGTDCNTSIFTIKTDGSGLTQLTDVPGIDSFPDWSPDGREIAFHTTRVDPNSGRWDIYVMSFDGAEVFPLTDGPGVNQFPSWSPDGTLVLFQSDRSGNPHLYTMRGTDGSDITLIAPEIPYAGVPDWSPTTP